MKIVFASDSFKGSLSSADTIRLLDKAAHIVWADCETMGVQVADGGEGTIDALVSSCNGEKKYVTVNDPLHKPVRAYYGIFPGKKAVIEMAQASGLTLVPSEKRNPWLTSSYGTGELVLAALDEGCTDITISLGGSATNDGGMGFAEALGVRFTDSKGNVLCGCGENLIKISNIDESGIDERIYKAKITALTDVSNPLCGENGATYIFGRQKGADRQMLDQLESGMCNYRDIIKSKYGKNPDKMYGAGAAGGLGTALQIFTRANVKSGIESILDMIDFDRLIKDADLIITGEGCTDRQSAYGKVMQGVGTRAKKQGIPVVGLSGGLGEGYEEMYKEGINSIITSIDSPMDIDTAMKRASGLYYKAAVRMFRMIDAGRNIGR